MRGYSASHHRPLIRIVLGTAFFKEHRGVVSFEEGEGFRQTPFPAGRHLETIIQTRRYLERRWPPFGSPASRSTALGRRDGVGSGALGDDAANAERVERGGHGHDYILPPPGFSIQHGQTSATRGSDKRHENRNEKKPFGDATSRNMDDASNDALTAGSPGDGPR